MSEKRVPTKHRVNTMSADISKKSRRLKQPSELHQILLPGAPPRKRPTKSPSAQRDPCPPVEGLRSSAAPEHKPTGEPIQKVLKRKAKLKPALQHEHEQQLDIVNIDVTDNVTIIPTEDTYGHDDGSDVDLDMEVDFNECFTTYNAATEQSTDMTELETRVLQSEDELNDLVLVELLPDDDYYNFNWTNDGGTFAGHREVFTESSGPTFDVSDKTPIDLFYEMFDTGLIDHLCTETNRYAEQKIASLKAENKLKACSRLHRWTPTDRDEIITFLAVWILQGLYPLPEEEKYFGYNGFGTMPYFARIMTYNRFLLLKSLYHFVDNKSLTDRSTLCKIQPVIDYFNHKFSTMYMPSQEIVIDESLFKRHGQLSFAQKIASRAAKTGVKSYELYESRTGYLWKFFVYVAKNSKTNPTIPTDGRATDSEIRARPPVIDQTDDVSYDRLQDETVDRPNVSATCPTDATAKILFDLIQPLLNRGHTLIMDNFHNSPLLLRCLKKYKTDCFGTLRLSRQFVPNTLKKLTKTDLRYGEVVASYCPDLSVMVWRDANLVSMISTYHYIQVGTQNKHDQLTFKPDIVLDYNRAMGGVGRKEQILSAQPMERQRNRIWYKKLFRRLVNIALFNAYIIFSSQNSKLSHRQFRTIMAEGLLKIHRLIDLTIETRLYANKTALRQVTPISTPVEDDHFPARSNVKRARCWMCSHTRNRDTRSIWKCIQCNVHLCIEHCFRDYHKQVPVE